MRYVGKRHTLHVQTIWFHRRGRQFLTSRIITMKTVVIGMWRFIDIFSYLPSLPKGRGTACGGRILCVKCCQMY